MQRRLCNSLARSSLRCYFSSDRGMSIKDSSPLYLRRSLELLVKNHVFKVAGVSFEGRQDSIKQLKGGEPVMLLRQQSNPYDNKAVSVNLLNGKQIGFVPRDMNHQFQTQELVYGYIEFIGLAPKTDIWGLRVSSISDLMPAFVSPLPLSLLGGLDSKDPGSRPKELEAKLQSLLGQDNWIRETSATKERSLGVCEVTGAPPSAVMLTYIPVWQFNPDKKLVKLMRLALVCQEVALTHLLLDLPLDSVEYNTAKKALISINCWGGASFPSLENEEQRDSCLHSISDERVQSHLQWSKGLRELILNEAWTLDLRVD